jgi:hypothetical protein
MSSGRGEGGRGGRGAGAAGLGIHLGLHAAAPPEAPGPERRPGQLYVWCWLFSYFCDVVIIDSQHHLQSHSVRRWRGRRPGSSRGPTTTLCCTAVSSSSKRPRTVCLTHLVSFAFGLEDLVFYLFFSSLSLLVCLFVICCFLLLF